MSKDEFKVELEIALGIAKWHPTDDQIEKIANYIISNQDDIDSVKPYILNICNDITWLGLEGIDNSDLNYLLALAIKTVDGSS